MTPSADKLYAHLCSALLDGSYERRSNQCGTKEPISVTWLSRSIGLASTRVLVSPAKAQPFFLTLVFLSSQKGHVQPAIRPDQRIAAPCIRRVGVIHLPLLADAPPTFYKATVARLLPLHKVVVSLGLELVCIHVVVLDGLDAFVLRDVEVVVEITPVRTHPRKGPAHALLVRLDLGDGGARDADKGRGARGQVIERRDVGGEKGARGAAGVPGRV